ncbi:protein AIG1-like [Solanum tuberosum]|uniref:protein AIG1-like n=1 Tax=Solanum tuberosum TaxID=4113 RepID=UPI00073A0885|nr:PREDICTED: protein AIG1-like [Solanum tuberosum]
MGGSAVAYDWEVTTNEKQTLVLLGRTGNGKSATGNSILNVIDTPGLFDFTGEPEVIGKEIVKCMELAMDGIHAVLLVLSVRTRFSREELAAIQSFQEFFGEKIRDYMIVVFTGGDELEDSDESLKYYLYYVPLQETIKLCDDRVVLFDNKTKDPKKKEEQLNQLLSLVTLVLDKNSGVPYTNELFKQLKALKGNSLIGDGVNQLNEPIVMSYEEHLKKLTEAVTSMLKEITHTYLEQWATDRADRIAEKQKSEAAHAKFEDDMRVLRDHLEHVQSDSGKWGCHIL